MMSGDAGCSPEAVLSALGLSAYQPVEGGVWGEGLLAAVRRDDSGERLLLKEKRSYLSDAELLVHLDLHRFAAGRGAPVAPIPPALVDRLPLRLPEGRLIEVQTWIGGRKVDPQSAADVAAAGRALARFHRAAEGFPWPAGSCLHQEPRERFGKAEYYRSFLALVLEDAEHPLLLELYDDLADARRSLRDLEPERPLHGDPAPSNFLIEEGECVLIDLDDAHLGPPDEDLAWLMTMCGALRWRGETCLGLCEGWEPELTRAAWAGYRSEQPESGEPLRLRPWLVASVVCAVVDCLTDEGGLILPREEFEENCHRALWLIDQTEDLRP
jgi:Ser/Thr protein kinase RdoA (MazF antagonist)